MTSPTISITPPNHGTTTGSTDPKLLDNVKAPKPNEISYETFASIIPEELIVILLQLICLPQNGNEDDAVQHGSKEPSLQIRSGYRWRLRMIDSIETLQNLHGQCRKNKNVNSSSPSELPQRHVELLSQIEQQLQQIRMEIHEFSTSIIPLERQQIISLEEHVLVWQQQQQQRQLHQPSAICTFLHRLLSEYQLQWQYEDQMILHVLHPTLDTWYDNSDESGGDMNSQLRFCIQILRRQWTIQQYHQYFQDNIELLMQLIEEQVTNDNEARPMEARRHTTKALLPSLQKKYRQCYFSTRDSSNSRRIKIDDGVTKGRPFCPFNDSALSIGIESTAGSRRTRQTIIDESFYYINRTNTAPHDIVKTILIIGSEGSGKTYLCNELEEQVGIAKASNISGMLYL